MLHELLETGNFDYGSTAERIQRIIDEFTIADIGTDYTIAVIGGNSGITKGTSRSTAGDCAIGVFCSQRSRQNFGICHLDVREKTLGPVTTVKQDTLVRVIAVVVVPIDQSAWF